MKNRSPFLTPATTYEELWRQVNYRNISFPTKFNLGVACLDDQDPAAIALIVVSGEGYRSHTFGEVKEQANRLANVLSDLGIGRGDVVAVIKAASFETAVSYMAILRLGAVLLPLSSRFGPDALAFRLSHGRARAVISSAENAAKIREALGERHVALIVTGECGHGEHSYEGVLGAASPAFLPTLTNSEDPAFLIYTSGTTGEPKGALHAHRVVFGHIPAMEALFDFYPRLDDVIWSPADWAWMAGLMAILVPAWWYGLPVVIDLDHAFSAERTLWLLQEHRVTLTLLPPTALRFIRAAAIDAPDLRLRAIVSGTEEMGADLLEWCEQYFGCVVNEGYGQTELNVCAGNCATVYPVKPGSLGRALPGTTVAVIDDRGIPVTGTEGEIAVDRCHPNALIEYWDNPAGTAEKFVGNWLRTGDLGVQDEEGYLWFVSRADDVINSSGYRIGPGEIENCLGGHEAVEMAAVVGSPDAQRGQVPKAFVVLRAGGEPSEDLAAQLRGRVRDRLARHEVPREIVFVEDLPRTTTGKIMRRTLRER